MWKKVHPTVFTHWRSGKKLVCFDYGYKCWPFFYWVWEEPKKCRKKKKGD